jgi:hypothetical protein
VSAGICDARLVLASLTVSLEYLKDQIDAGDIADVARELVDGVIWRRSIAWSWEELGICTEPNSRRRRRGMSGRAAFRV